MPGALNTTSAVGSMIIRRNRDAAGTARADAGIHRHSGPGCRPGWRAAAGLPAGGGGGGGGVCKRGPQDGSGPDEVFPGGGGGGRAGVPLGAPSRDTHFRCLAAPPSGPLHRSRSAGRERHEGGPPSHCLAVSAVHAWYRQCCQLCAALGKGRHQRCQDAHGNSSSGSSPASWWGSHRQPFSDSRGGGDRGSCMVPQFRTERAHGRGCVCSSGVALWRDYCCGQRSPKRQLWCKRPQQ
mmetsp:Transcript_19412/g.58660  ORF Transcript_19412/g.58660 Transcript_19412/m.58660 type:complete len:238 (+) Transcript_19412:137-850(+)